MQLEQELERVGHWECVAKVERQKRWRSELEASLISASDSEATAIRAKTAELDEWIPLAEHANSAVYESIVKGVDLLNDLVLQGEQSLEELRLIFDEVKQREPVESARIEKLLLEEFAE
jgi:hypothetical protein